MGLLHQIHWQKMPPMKVRQTVIIRQRHILMGCCSRGKPYTPINPITISFITNTAHTAGHFMNCQSEFAYKNIGDNRKSKQMNIFHRNSTVESHKEEVYEIDADPDRIDEEMTRSQADSITKQGYLYKGPDTASDRMFAHIGSKSFKRRYCYLRQEVDGTYMLELHKDEKQCEAKATIVMDFCTEVVQV